MMFAVALKVFFNMVNQEAAIRLKIPSLVRRASFFKKNGGECGRAWGGLLETDGREFKKTNKVKRKNVKAAGLHVCVWTL